MSNCKQASCNSKKFQWESSKPEDFTWREMVFRMEWDHRIRDRSPLSKYLVIILDCELWLINGS